MDIVNVVIGSGILILLFVFLWLKERRNSRIEHIAYDLRSNEGQTENTKANITGLEAGFREAMFNRLRKSRGLAPVLDSLQWGVFSPVVRCPAHGTAGKYASRIQVNVPFCMDTKISV